MKLVLDYLKHQRNSQIIPFIQEGKNILELGCGQAPLTKYLNSTQNYTGIDRAEIRLNKKNCKIIKSDLEKEEINLEQEFDLILLVAFIEHLKNPDPLIVKIKKVLSEKGKIVLTTPTPLGNFLHTIGAYMGLTAMSAVHDHFIIYNKKNILKLCERNNLTLRCYHRFLFGLNQIIVLENKK